MGLKIGPKYVLFMRYVPQFICERYKQCAQIVGKENMMVVSPDSQAFATVMPNVDFWLFAYLNTRNEHEPWFRVGGLRLENGVYKMEKFGWEERRQE